MSKSQITSKFIVLQACYEITVPQQTLLLEFSLHYVHLDHFRHELVLPNSTNNKKQETGIFTFNTAINALQDRHYTAVCL
jgi:hypothetical protein